jgi:mRNA interferase HigB
MRIISRRTLREFVASRAGHKDHRTLKVALDAWFDEVRKARWESTADIKRHYASASVLTAERIVFNIKGNRYRLIVSVDFEKSIVCKRGKSGGGMILRFTGGHESDSFWECCRLQTLTAFRTPI